MRNVYRLSLAGMVLAGLAATGGCRNSTPIGGSSRPIGGTQQAQGWGRDSGGSRPAANTGGVNMANQPVRPGGINGSGGSFGGNPQGGFQQPTNLTGGGGLPGSPVQPGGTQFGASGQPMQFPAPQLNTPPVPPAPPGSGFTGQERTSGSSHRFPTGQDLQPPAGGQPLVRETQHPTFPQAPEPDPIRVNDGANPPPRAAPPSGLQVPPPPAPPVVSPPGL
jgi:hypothetical protein